MVAQGAQHHGKIEQQRRGSSTDSKGFVQNGIEFLKHILLLANGFYFIGAIVTSGNTPNRR
jgi:hypothetical protein